MLPALTIYVCPPCPQLGSPFRLESPWTWPPSLLNSDKQRQDLIKVLRQHWEVWHPTRLMPTVLAEDGVFESSRAAGERPKYRHAFSNAYMPTGYIYSEYSINASEPSER